LPDTRSVQYRSTIRLNRSRGAAALTAGEGVGAGGAPQAASPRKASPSETARENRVMNQL
jgi:hypothetical protein